MHHELSHIVDALPALVWTARADLYADFLNQCWCEYTGLQCDEALGWNWQRAIHPDDLPMLLERWEAIVASGEPGELQARIRRSDGAYRWFQFNASPLRDASGQVARWCGVNTDIEDRRRAEEVGHGYEGRFRLIVDGLPAWVTLMNPAGELVLANRHVLEYFGCTFEELKARTTGDTFHPDDRPDVLKAWWTSVDTGDPYDFEGRHRRVDGVYRWFHMRGFPLRDAEGHIVLWYLLHTDVDDRKRAEALLAGEKQLLEMVAGGHSMPAILEVLCQFVESIVSRCYCSVVLIDASGTRLEYGAAPSLPASFLATTVGRPVSVDSGPCAMASYLNEQVIATDLRSETRWAAYEWCPMALAHGLQACWSTPITSTAGKVLGAFAVYYDEPKAPTALHQSLIKQFTQIASIAIERAQAERALQRSEAFLAEGQRLSQTGSFSWRVGTDEVTWSEQLYRIYEFEVGTPVTLEMIRSRVYPGDVSLLDKLKTVDQARSGRNDFEWQYRVRMPDDSIKYLHAVAHATQDQDGQLEYIAAVQDVTARRLSEDALDKARAQLAHVARVTSLGVLTASIAHELNQPLTAISTNANVCVRMLETPCPDVDGAREIARRTSRDSKRASEVIARLRALFSKKEATADLVDLNEAIREVIALSASELQRNRVILRQDLSTDLPPVVGDRVQLQQVIFNLLLNASDAMMSIDDRPRQVTITTARDDGDRLRVGIRDTGMGFDPESVDKLFEAFYTTKSSGMGIGLSVSRSIIERHQGRIWAVPNDGPGTTFSFSLPFAPERGARHEDVRTSL